MKWGWGDVKTLRKPPKILTLLATIVPLATQRLELRTQAERDELSIRLYAWKTNPFLTITCPYY